MQTKNLLVLVATLLFSVSALAGLFQPAPVTVTVNPDGSGIATGDMTTASNAKNDVEFIGCGVRFIGDGVGGVFHFGFCQAADADEVQITCTTQNLDLLAGLNSIADFSFITFGWDENEECTRIGNSTQSFYLDKIKSQKSKK